MPTFNVYRRGYNAANQSSQSSTPDVLVRTVAAANPEEAVEFVAPTVTVYNGQYLWAEPEEEAEARRRLVEQAIGRFMEGRPEGTVLIRGVYRPNGGVRDWQFMPTAESPPQERWLSVEEEREDFLKLFLYDGPVLHCESFEWVSADQHSGALLDLFCGEDQFTLKDIVRFSEWLRDEMGLEDDGDPYRFVLAFALRKLADDLEEV